MPSRQHGRTTRSSQSWRRATTASMPTQCLLLPHPAPSPSELLTAPGPCPHGPTTVPPSTFWRPELVSRLLGTPTTLRLTPLTAPPWLALTFLVWCFTPIRSLGSGPSTFRHISRELRRRIRPAIFEVRQIWWPTMRISSSLRNDEVGV